MDAEAWVRSIQQSRELWGAVAGSAAVIATERLARAWGGTWAVDPSLVVGAGVLVGLVAGAWSLPMALAIVAGVALGHTLPPRAAASTPWLVASAWVATLSLYVGVPETKRSLALGGAVVVAGLACLALGRRWWAAAVVTTAGLAAIAVVDGHVRVSPMFGALGVIAIHLLLTTAPVRPSVVVVGWAAMLISARVGGLRDSHGEAAVLAVACTLLVAALVVVDRGSALRDSPQA